MASFKGYGGYTGFIPRDWTPTLPVDPTEPVDPTDPVDPVADSYLWDLRGRSYSILEPSVSFTGSMIYYYTANAAKNGQDQYLSDGEETATRAYVLFRDTDQTLLFNSTKFQVFIDDVPYTSQLTVYPLDGLEHKMELRALESINIYTIGARYSAEKMYYNIMRDIVITGVTGRDSTTLTIPLDENFSSNQDLLDSNGNVIGSKYNDEALDYYPADEDRQRIVYDGPVLTKMNLVWDGDSRTQGVGADSLIPIPDRVEAMFSPSQLLSNFAVPGQKTEDAVARFPTRVPYQFNDKVTENWYVINGFGINDISSGLFTFATIRDNLIFLADSAKALGFKVAIATVPPRSSNNAAAVTKLAELNAWILNSGLASIDIAIDLNADSRIGTHSYDYFFDSTHLNDAGQDIWAARMAIEISAAANISGLVVTVPSGDEPIIS